MNRHTFLASGAACVAAAPALRAVAGAPPGDVSARLGKMFAALPGRKSFQIRVDSARAPWSVSHDPNSELFIGSCFKTFVLAEYLRAAEAGRLSVFELLTLDDGVRSLSSPVFAELDGKIEARFVLEAMIAHSDNTATDMAMRRAGVKNVRSFVEQAGLTHTRIPDDTRVFFSYLAGYPAGFDMGWKGCREVMAGKLRHPVRPALNSVQTMSSTAAELASYYRRAATGAFFRRAETQVEFKRILAMSDAIPKAIPVDTPAFMKGGSIDWHGFYTMALAGWMTLDETPVSFALLLNWTDRDGGQNEVTARYVATVRAMLELVKDRVDVS